MSEPETDEEGPRLPRFESDAQVCGNCKLWRAHSHNAQGWVGTCLVQSHRAPFPPEAPICDAFSPRMGVTAKPLAKAAKSPRVRSDAQIERALESSPKRPSPNTEVNLFDGELAMTRAELMDIFLEATGQREVPLAPKWEGGVVRLIPKDAQLAPKDIPVDSLFHKIVMVRDRLRTLEQRINAHTKLTDAEKVEMQQYVTRCYGSLTTFNVLFHEKNDQFVGQKDKGE